MATTARTASPPWAALAAGIMEPGRIRAMANGFHKIKMTLAEEVTFFNKGAILKELEGLPKDTYLELDVRNTRFLDYDIIEILDDFSYKALERNIHITLIAEKGTVENPARFMDYINLRPNNNKRKTA